MRRSLVPILALAALVLGAGSADGRSLATTRVIVDTFGSGVVTSEPSGISCGEGSTTCYTGYSRTGTVTLTASPAHGWGDGSWGGTGGCAGPTSDPCTLPLDGADHLVTAGFLDSSGNPLRTLTVGYDTTDLGNGTVSGPERTPPGSEVNCNSAAATPDCTWTVLHGSTLTVFQTAAAGKIFEGWGGDCSGNGESCTVLMDQDRSVGVRWGTPGATTQLTVNVVGQGQVRGNGINCPGVCTASQLKNSSVTLTAYPSDGYVLSRWDGPCAASTSPTCTITMDDDANVTATFAQENNNLTVTVDGSGSVTGGSGAINCGAGANVCSAAFAPTQTVSLVASPATGSTFAGWSGACGGTATICTILMSQARAVTATFSSGFTLSVSVSGNGTVSGGGITCGAGGATCTTGGHALNSTATLVASPSAGATFSGWSGGACSGAVTTCTVTFTGPVSVTATFTSGGSTTALLSVSVSGPGRVAGGGIACGNGAAACSISVPVGSTATLTETPAAGAKFTGWGGACSGTATTCTVSLSASIAVSATFTGPAAPGTLTLGVSGRGSVSTRAGACSSTGPAKTCVQHFKAGAGVTLTALPAAGQSFLGWSGACKGVKTTCTLKLTTARTAGARFTTGSTSGATLRSLGSPIVVKTATGYTVVLRFLTTVRGTARVDAVRAGRTVTSVSTRVAAGQVRIGPFPVPLSGLYAFEIRLAGARLTQRACLGQCGSAAPPPPFLLVREPPAVTRSGDVWSVTLHARANQIYDGRIRASRPGRLLVSQHFLGRAGRIALGPFLLGPGNYTLTLTGIDAYGRTRTLVWAVTLGL